MSNLEKQKSAIEILTVNNDEAIKIAKEDINLVSGKSTIKAVKELQKQYEDQYCSIEIATLKDLKGYESLKNGLKDVKSFRIDTDARRKELTAPALKFQKDLKKHADQFIDGWKSIEEKIQAKIVHFEDLQQAEKLKLENERHEKLVKNGWTLVGNLYSCGIQRIDAVTLGDLKDDDMEHYIEVGKQELERQAAEEKRKADEAAALKKEREEIEAERKKLLEQQKEMDEFRKWKESQKKSEPEPEKKAEPVPEKTPEKKAPAKKKTDEDLSSEEIAFVKAKREIYKYISRKDIKLTIAVIKQFIEDLEYEK